MEIIIDFASKFQKDQHRNQESLFGDKSGASIVYPQLKKIESWSVEKELKHEKAIRFLFIK